MPRYYEPIEYDAERDRLTVRGFNLHMQPYAIEIRGSQALVWVDVLRNTGIYHRKSNGSIARNERSLE